MSSGYMLRHRQAFMRGNECVCGHNSHEHRLMTYGSAGYDPNQFHCDIDGCDCIVNTVQPRTT